MLVQGLGQFLCVESMLRRETPQQLGGKLSLICVDAVVHLPEFVFCCGVLSAFDVGRIINLKTARSQAYSGIIVGIGMASMEHTIYDQRDGTVVNSNLADYAVPVNADIHSIDVSFIDKPDPYIDDQGIGARGVGEITITGVAAAVANAVYHATGKRIRELPITPDRLI